MSAYREAIELIRIGAIHNGTSLGYRHCRDILTVIEDYQNESLTKDDIIRELQHDLIVAKQKLAKCYDSAQVAASR